MKSLAIKINKVYAEKLRREIKEFIREDLAIVKDSSFVYFPVQDSIKNYKYTDYKDLFTLIEMEFTKRNNRPDADIHLSYDLVGDIAILSPDVEDAVRLAKVLLSRKNINVVLKKASSIEGTFRTRRYDYIAGKRRTETIHREHSCIYKLDLEKTYFSPRLSTERKRVVDKMKKNDHVIDMFAGVGPFSILAAKKDCNVIAIDCNPHAIKYLNENKRLNKVKNNLEIILGDSGSVLSKNIHDIADHIIMNLPFSTYDFLEEAARLVKKEEGIIYFYSVGREKDETNSKDKLLDEEIKKVEKIVGDINVRDARIVRPYSPYTYHLSIEFSINERIV